jgi:alkanesulfonate monooxygenase SsuD/methylene tetrahydromethanopterin reductase-like flavin-dependent oxidoreductase (luciferase family)
MPIKLGLALPAQKTFSTGRDIPAVARAAEEIGYDSLWPVRHPGPARGRHPCRQRRHASPRAAGV